MKYLFLLLASLAPVLIFAHAGHGNTHADQFLHYLSSPVHAIPSLAAGLLLGILWYRKRASRHA
jgi:hypothetical protein